MRPVTSNRLRTALAVLLFGGLAALEVHDGLDRLQEVRDRRRRELLDLADRQQEPLVREVSERIGDGRRHASHLAVHPFVRALLREPENGGGRAEELGRILRPYLASFPEIDRLRILDASARERFRCERMGGGVATLPTGLLDPSPSVELARLAEEAEATDVAVSRLSYDAERVEVEQADRRVVHLVASVRDRDRTLGAVVVTIYAAPLLHALAAFEPLPGTTTCLLGAEGRTFAPVLSPDEVGGPRGRATTLGGTLGTPSLCTRLLQENPELRSRVLSGERRIHTSDAVLFARDTGVDPASFLVSAVPEDALAPGILPGEARRTVLRTLIVLGAIGLGSAFFVRASQRAARQAETERYAQRIREESEKQRALMDAAADMVLIVEPDSETLQDWNPRARELLGLEGAAGPRALGPIAGAFEGDGGERLREGIRRASSGTDGPVQVSGLALVRDGSRFDLDARCVGIDYGGRRLVELSLSDRTRERDMERRARTAERLSALGMLTAGVAHEINNPLEGIGNYLSLLERTDDPERRAKHLAQVRRGFQRIREITGELLPLAGSARQDAWADLSRVVERAVSMARFSRDLREVEVDLEGFERPLNVAGSEGGLEQIVLNLLMNAGRAMGGSGRVRVVASAPDGGRVELAVEDEGPGVPEEDLERVFDPFFTRSGGTGLGLSVSYQIARAHGGDLSVENPSGGGARFSLRLPLASPDDGREDAGA